MGQQASDLNPFAPTLRGSYEVQEIRRGRRVPLGSGTMGEVWPCTHRATHELRACKSILKQRRRINLEMRSIC